MKVNLVSGFWLSLYTSHSAYDAMSTESDRVKIDGFLNPNFMYIPKK